MNCISFYSCWETLQVGIMRVFPSFSNFNSNLRYWQYQHVVLMISVSVVFAEITELESRRNKTQAIKQVVMQELFAGGTRLV